MKDLFNHDPLDESIKTDWVYVGRPGSPNKDYKQTKPNLLKSSLRTGTTLEFDINSFYNRDAYLTSGNLTLDFTGGVPGMTAVCYTKNYVPSITNSTDEYVVINDASDPAKNNLISILYDGVIAFVSITAFDLTPPFAIDLQGLNVSRAWVPAKVSNSTLDTCIKIRNGTGASGTGSYYYVFWDNNGEISLNSLTAVTTSGNGTPETATPGTDTLLDIILAGGSSEWFVYDWFCQYTGQRLNKSAGGLGTWLVESNVVVVDGGKPALKFQNTNSLNTDGIEGLGGGGLSEMNDGSSFAITAIFSSADLETSRAVVGSGDSATDSSGIRILCDTRSTNDRATLLQNQSGSFFGGDMDASLASTDRRVITGIVNGGTDLYTVLNRVEQTQKQTITGNYNNILFQIGAQTNDNAIFLGNLQGVIVHNTNISTAIAQQTYDNLNDYFTF